MPMSIPVLRELSPAPPAPMHDLIADAVLACAAARAADLVLRDPAIQKLRAVREAGRLLSLVPRTDGGRPSKNWSPRVTSYQSALRRAGISRQTATWWQRVAEIPPTAFERFLVEAPLVGRDLTVAE